jgi:peptide chain release factor 1
LKDLKIDFQKGGGPGGQSVNKTESACRVTHIPTGIQALNQDSRDQNHNKKIAIDIVKQKLFKIEHDKYYQEIGRKRRIQMGSTDRSDKIRTYNFPQDRITDHRLSLTRFGISSFMSGDLVEEFIQAFRDLEYEAKIKEMFEDVNTDSTQ